MKIGEGTECIWRRAFSHCDSLRSLALPASVVRITEDAFRKCHSLKSVTVAPGNRRYSVRDGWLYDKSGTRLLLALNVQPAAAIPPGTVHIGQEAFRGASECEAISIPEGVASIGNGAFGFCRLKELRLPDSLKEIGPWAFHDCHELESVRIGNGLERIAEGAFRDCEKLRDIKVSGKNPNYSTRDGLLCDKKGKTLLLVPPTLASVTVPDSVTDIGDDTCAGSRMKAVSLPSKLRRIGRNAFARCKNLEDIELPNGLLSIGKGAFKECSALKTFVIPDSVEYIGDELLSECMTLDSVKIGAHVPAIGQWSFFWCERLREVDIPGNVALIARGAFKRCKFLHQIVLGQGIEKSTTRPLRNAMA